MLGAPGCAWTPGEPDRDGAWLAFDSLKWAAHTYPDLPLLVMLEEQTLPDGRKTRVPGRYLRASDFYVYNHPVAFAFAGSDARCFVGSAIWSTVRALVGGVRTRTPSRAAAPASGSELPRRPFGRTGAAGKRSTTSTAVSAPA